MANFYGTSMGNIASALRATGGDPSILEELERQQEREQRALGPNPYEEPEPPPEPEIQDQPFDPRAPTRELQSQYAEGQNQGLGLAERKGEIGAGVGQRSAEEAGVLRERNEAGYQRAMQASTQLESDEARYREMADARLNEVIAAVGEPPPEKRGEVLQIIGAMLSAGNGRGRAIGTGLQLLGQRMNGSLQEWGQKLAANKEALGAVLSTTASARGGAQARATLEKSLSEIAYGVYGAAIEQVKQEGASEEAVRAADELQLGLRQDYLAQEMKRRAQQAKAQGAAQRSRADEELYRMQLDMLAQVVADGGGKRAQEIYAERVKASQDVREGEAKIADVMTGTAKKRYDMEQSTKAGPKMTEGERKLDMLVQGARGAYDRLLPQEGHVNRGATKETWVPDFMRDDETLQQRADLKALAMAVLRAESGASITDSEIENKYEALPINSGDPAVRKQGVRDLISAFEALDVRDRLPKSPEEDSAFVNRSPLKTLRRVQGGR